MQDLLRMPVSAQEGLHKSNHLPAPHQMMCERPNSHRTRTRRARQRKQMRPVVINGSVHTAHKQHQRKNIPICMPKASSTQDARVQIQTQILGCCLGAVWTLLFTSIGSICFASRRASCVDKASGSVWALESWCRLKLTYTLEGRGDNRPADTEKPQELVAPTDSNHFPTGHVTAGKLYIIFCLASLFCGWVCSRLFSA